MKRLLTVLAVSVVVLVMSATSHAGFFFISGTPGANGDGPILSSGVFTDSTACDNALLAAGPSVIQDCVQTCTRAGGLFIIAQLVPGKGGKTSQALVATYGLQSDCLAGVADATAAGFKNIAPLPCTSTFRCGAK